jgi:guanylate kinase
VDQKTFLDRAAEGGFLEWATILGEYYGTPMPEPPEGCDVVLEIDVQGARQVLERRPEAYCVLIRAPSPDVQEQRLRGRGDSPEHIARRMALGKAEEAEGQELASYVVVNDDLDGAVRDLSGIVEDVRRREGQLA